MSRLYLMVTISNRNMRNKFQDFFQRHGSFVVFGSLARGTANSARLDYFGLEASEKVVTACVVTGQMWKQLKHGLIQEMQIDVAGTGIAFIIPMGSVGGKKVLQFLIQNQPYEKEEESQLKGTEYELLVAIADQGSMDEVMDAARGANAGGGTVLHAKGTGMERAKKFLGISLAEEKEMVLIVTKTSQKNDIMRAIMEKCGLGTKNHTIVFSLPVTSAIGLRQEETEDDA